MSSPSSDSFDSEERLLQGEDEKHSNNRGYLPIGHHSGKRRWVQRISLGWIVAVFSFVLNVGLLIQSTYLGARSSSPRLGSFEAGFSTDMGKQTESEVWSPFRSDCIEEPAKEAMEALRMPFTGEIKFDENDTMYRDMPGPQYFGEPRPELDDNLHNLMYAAGMDLEEEEITRAGLKDTTWEEPQGGLWRTG